MSLILRFADFFSVQSLTHKCANNLDQSELALVRLLELSDRRVGPLSALTSDLLELAHPLLQTCAFSWANELTEGETYVNFSSTLEVLKTI